MKLLQSIVFVTKADSTQDRLKSLNDQLGIRITANTNTLIIESDKSIGIANSRSIIEFLASTPQGQDSKIVIIPQAQTLTPEAQNSLLKILEEPPAYALIVLITKNPYQLLQTITSRCQIISTTAPLPDQTHLQLSQQILTLAPLDRLSLTDQFIKSHTPQEFAQSLIHEMRTKLRQQPTQANLINLTLSLYSHKLLTRNVNPKLVIDQLLLKLK